MLIWVLTQLLQEREEVGHEALKRDDGADVVEVSCHLLSDHREKVLCQRLDLLDNVPFAKLKGEVDCEFVKDLKTGGSCDFVVRFMG